MVFDRKSMREELLNRTKESYATKDRGAGRMTSVLKPELGIMVWWAGEGQHEIDILPFFTSKDGIHPDPKVKPGKWDYRWDGYLHRFVGPNDQDMVCPLSTYHQAHPLRGPCPICERRQELTERGAPPGVADVDEWVKKTLNPLRPTRYCIYNIICYDEGQEKKGVQVWPISHFLFEREIQSIVKSTALRIRAPGEIVFASPEREVGKTIRFERKGTGRENTQYFGYVLVERDYDIPDGVLEKVYCLDEIIHVPSYDELAEAFFATAKFEAASRGGAEPERGVGARVFEETGEPRSAHSRRFEAFQEGSAREEVSPRPRRARHTEPADREPVGEKDCPAGHEFGNDIDQFEDCEECGQDKYDACSNRAEEIEAERHRAAAAKRISARRFDQPKVGEEGEAPAGRARRKLE